MTDIIAEGRYARALLESQAFKPAHDQAVAAIKDDWARASTPEEREACFYTLEGLRRFVKQLGITAERGTLAENAANPTARRSPLI